MSGRTARKLVEKLAPETKVVGYWVGCTVTSLAREISRSAEAVLKHAGVRYELLGTEECCGIPLLLAGHAQEAREMASRAGKRLGERKIDLLVTSCPSCYRAFTGAYAGLDPQLSLPTLHFTEFAEQLVSDGRLNPTTKITLRATYQDPCELGRGGDVYESPRKIIGSVPGVDFVELPLNRANSTCCGGGGLIKAAYPMVSIEVALEKLKTQVNALNADAIVTACPFCYLNFREALDISGTKIRVLNAEQLLAEAVGAGVTSR